MRKISGLWAALGALCFAAGAGLWAQQPYRLPPQEIVAILDAPPTLESVLDVLAEMIDGLTST